MVMILSILCAATIFFLMLYYYSRKHANVIREKIIGHNNCYVENRIYKTLFPLIKCFAPLFAKIRFDSYKSRISILLKSSGLSDNVSVGEFMAYQMILSFMFLGLIAFLFWNITIHGIFFSLLLGVLYPLIWLKALIKSRREEINYTLPNVLDLLSLSVEAGLDFVPALERVSRNEGGLLVKTEIRRMLDRMKLGATRRTALLEFKDRLDNPATDSFVSTLVQADRLGTPVGKVLKAYAGKLREERFLRAEKAGITASQKLLFPLVFCIMPAVFIIVFGPIFLMWKNGGFQGIFQ